MTLHCDSCDTSHLTPYNQRMNARRQQSYLLGLTRWKPGRFRGPARRETVPSGYRATCAQCATMLPEGELVRLYPNGAVYGFSCHRGFIAQP